MVMRPLRASDRQAVPDLSMPREVKVLAGVAFVVALGFGIVGPALPLFADQFGVGHAVAGLAISVFAFARLASALLNGKLVERYGARSVLAVGLALQAVTTIAAGLAPTFTLVIILRGIGGVGSAAFTTSALALVLRTAAPAIRGRAASRYQGGFLIGAVGGPGLGGFLAEISPRLAFVAYGVLLAVAGAIAMTLLRNPSRQLPPAEADDTGIPAETLLAERSEEGLEILGRPDADAKPLLGLRSRAFAAAMLLNFGSGWVLYGLRNSLIPVFGTEVLGHSAAWVGAIFLVGSGVQVLVLLRAGRLADQLGRRPLMVAGGLAGVLASVALMPQSSSTYVLAMICLGVAAALAASAAPAVVGDVTSSGTGVALFSMSADFAAVLGPLVGGLLADRYGYAMAFGTGTVIFAISTVGSVIMQETAARSRITTRHQEADAVESH